MDQKKEVKINHDNIGIQIELLMRQYGEVLNLNTEGTLFYNIKLVMWEILSNLLKHNEELEHTAYILIEKNKSHIKLTISHTARSFNWEDKISFEPTFNEIGGRGLFLITQLADSFQFSDGGKTSIIIFSISKKDIGGEQE